MEKCATVATLIRSVKHGKSGVATAQKDLLRLHVDVAGF